MHVSMNADKHEHINVLQKVHVQNYYHILHFSAFHQSPKTVLISQNPK
jgi:hypothetical protein